MKLRHECLFDGDDLIALLEQCSNDELDPIVRYIVRSWDNRLESEHLYLLHQPDHRVYLGLIETHLRRAGGNALRNVFRGSGPPYSDIVRDVCRHFSIALSRHDDILRMENKLLFKIFEDAWAKMSEEERKSTLEQLRRSGTKIDFTPAGSLLLAVTQANAGLNGSFFYQLSEIVANAFSRSLLERGVSLAINAGLTRAVGILAGPIGWAISSAWSAIDFASHLAGPTLSVTAPCVVHVAYLRQKKLKEARESNSADSPFQSMFDKQASP